MTLAPVRLRRIDSRRFSLAAFRDKLLALALFVVGDKAARRVENGARGTVVVFELNELRARKVFFEVENVSKIRSPKVVDGLILIPHHEDVLVRSEETHQAVLNPVCVLVLVHQEAPEASLGEGACFLGAFQQLDRADEKVVEVDAASVL